uniref:Uncharacterized protein n=1 Tax=Anguilla anguilla TaxID=7936 RepID=A0A0E9PQ92_ANGAN
MNKTRVKFTTYHRKIMIVL